MRGARRGPAGSIAPGPRRTWQAAGGAIPSFGASNLGGGATPATVGAGANILSTFNRIGVECFATMRIHADGTNSAGVGAMTLKGFPVLPRVVGSGVDGGQNIGYGFVIDGTDYSFHPLRVVIDPYYSETEPLLFCSAAVDAGALVPATFLDGTIIAHDTMPIDWGDVYFLNLTFQYEGV